MENKKIVSVTDLNKNIKKIIEGDRTLASIWVKGELSNFTNHYKTGHMYMTIKDEGSAIKAVMFSRDAAKLRFKPESGMKVIVHGRVSVFERDGQYQLYLSEMEPDGIGALHLAFEQCKAKLAAEGLFDTSRKKQIPRLPLSIGVITSPTGAAVRDIINVLGRRFPTATVKLYPVLVQGDDAPPQLIDALDFFAVNRVDVIIIGRGGGSIEDLWAFNNEDVARAIARSPIPIISAVGHETDFTIADFVADVRAPTPSAAAEIAVPDRLTLKTRFANLGARLLSLTNARLTAEQKKVSFLGNRKVFENPSIYIDDRKMAVLALSRRLSSGAERMSIIRRRKLESAAGKLDALSPLAVLGRGYSLVMKNGVAVRSTGEIKIGDKVELTLAGGKAIADITEVYNNG